MEKLPYTPNSHITSALRTVWMRSRERREALRNTGNTCSNCRVKQSKAKLSECRVMEVHHLHGHVNWGRILKVIREELLQDPVELAPLCPDCHKCIDGRQHGPIMPPNFRLKPPATS